MLIPVAPAVARCRSDPAARDCAIELNVNVPPCRMLTMDVETRPRPVVTGIRGSGAPHQLSPAVPISALADGLLEAGCVQIRRSSPSSPGWNRPSTSTCASSSSYPSLLARGSRAYVTILRGLTFDRLAALPYAALPIAHRHQPAGRLADDLPAQGGQGLRHEGRDRGRCSLPGERVVVIDDLTTTGGSKFEAIEKLTAAGLQVRDVVVLIDRQSGAAESLAQAGYRLHAVFTLTQLLDYWEHADRQGFPAEQIGRHAGVFFGGKA